LQSNIIDRNSLNRRSLSLNRRSMSLNRDSLNNSSLKRHSLSAQSLKRLSLANQSLKRNKRCLLAYHYHRLKKLEEFCWELGHIPQELLPNLSSLETDFSTEYQSIINNYASNFTGIDLSSSLEPPKDPYIEIRVLKDCGEIYTENGLVTLSKNSQHYLRRTDVEHLINEGYLKHIK